MKHDEEMKWASDHVMQPELDYLVEEYWKWCEQDVYCKPDSLTDFLVWLSNRKLNI